MSEDGWGEADSKSVVAEQPASAMHSIKPKGFGGENSVNEGNSEANTGGFGGQSNSKFGGAQQGGGFGNKTAGFGGGSQASSGFGGGSQAPSGFGGGSQAPSGFGGGSQAPSGFGGGSQAPSGFGGTQSSTGFGNKSVGRFAGNQTSSGFGEKKATGFGGNQSSSGFGEKQASGFGGNQPSAGFGGSQPSAGFGGSQPTSGFGNQPSSGFGESGGGFGGNKSSGFGGNGAGFGGKSSGGFGGPKTEGGFGGGNQNGGGFGSSGTGFGGGGGFGGDNQSSGGFGQRSNGFGDGGGGGGDRSCHNCKQTGHFSRECPEPRKPREDTRTCYNCNQSGHSKRDCPEPPKDGNGGGFGGNRSGGFGNSSGFGGTSSFGGGNGFGGNGSEMGFGGGDGGFGETRGPIKCFNCNEEGHRSGECTAPKKGCFNCGQQDHMSRECPEPPKPREGEEGKARATFVPEEDAIEQVFANQTIAQGQMFDKFFDADVTISSGGTTVKITPVKDFSEAGLTEKVLSNIRHAGYAKTTPIQQYSMPLVKLGRDIMACAQTGSGKTAAFLLPIMTKLIDDNDFNTRGECGSYPRCLILTPTRELADQIYNEGRKFAYQTMIELKPVYGGLNVGYNKTQIEQGATILVGTVGRVKHFIEAGIIKLDKIRFVVLDEADRMIDSMGFGDEIQQIINAPGMPNKDDRQTLMFSATFPDSVQHAAKEYLKDAYVMITIDKIGAANKCVLQEFIRLSRAEKRDKLLELLGVDLDIYATKKDAEVYNQKTIVFVSQRSLADTVGATLCASGVPSTTIHGAREQKERNEALRSFRVGSTPVLIATAVAERGLDIKGVDHVINYDLPDNIDDYVHRIGRTGRVGNSGRATSFVTEENDSLIPDLLKILGDAEQIVPEWMAESGHYGAQNFGSSATAAQDDEAW